MKRHVHLKGPQQIVKGMSRPPADAPITSGNPVREAPLNTVISSAPLVDVMSDEGIDLLQAVQGAYRTDALFCDILDNIISNTPDLSNIPEEYHDYADIFSKGKADTLPPHCRYNLKINLEDGTEPLIGLVLPFSQIELQALCEFIDEHLSSGFI